MTGGTLLKVGLCQQKLGSLERDFSFSAAQGFGEPLKKFLETDLKVAYQYLLQWKISLSLFLDS